MTASTPDLDVPVCKTITVKASPELAFQVFTAELDSWWPYTHHIGSSPMTKAILECRPGGRCYSLQQDGTDCDWGSIVVWEPPVRFVMAWRINTSWKFEPDLAKSSEVEVRFTPEPGGLTRVDLEHRGFSRMGPGFESMRNGVDGTGGWNGLLQLFAAAVERHA